MINVYRHSIETWINNYDIGYSNDRSNALQSMVPHQDTLYTAIANWLLQSLQYSFHISNDREEKLSRTLFNMSLSNFVVKHKPYVYHILD